MRMMMVVIENTVGYDDIQVIGLMIVMMTSHLIVTFLFFFIVLSLFFPCHLSLFRHHQVSWIMTLRMFLNGCLSMLRRHHQERQLAWWKCALILLKYFLGINDTPIFRIPRLRLVLSLFLRVINPVTTPLLITVNHVNLVVFIKIYPHDFILVKTRLGLCYLVPVIVLLAFLQADVLLFQFGYLGGGVVTLVIVMRGFVHRFWLNRVEAFCCQFKILYIVSWLLVCLALVITHRLLVKFYSLRVQHVVIS